MQGFPHAEEARRAVSHTLRPAKQDSHCFLSTQFPRAVTMPVTETAERPGAIAGYEDWPDYAARNTGPGTGFEGSSPAARQLALTLGVPAVSGNLDYTVHREVEHDGVVTSLLGWQTGFGPRTAAWFVRPAEASGPLPGVVALHCHGGIKSHGAERLVAMPDGGTSSAHQPGPVPAGLRTTLYGGRPLATLPRSRASRSWPTMPSCGAAAASPLTRSPTARRTPLPDRRHCGGRPASYLHRRNGITRRPRRTRKR